MESTLLFATLYVSGIFFIFPCVVHWAIVPFILPFACVFQSQSLIFFTSFSSSSNPPTSFSSLSLVECIFSHYISWFVCVCVYLSRSLSDFSVCALLLFEKNIAFRGTLSIYLDFSSLNSVCACVDCDDRHGRVRMSVFVCLLFLQNS